MGLGASAPIENLLQRYSVISAIKPLWMQIILGPHSLNVATPMPLGQHYPGAATASQEGYYVNQLLRNHAHLHNLFLFYYQCFCEVLLTTLQIITSLRQCQIFSLSTSGPRDSNVQRPYADNREGTCPPIRRGTA